MTIPTLLYFTLFMMLISITSQKDITFTEFSETATSKDKQWAEDKTLKTKYNPWSEDSETSMKPYNPWDEATEKIKDNPWYEYEDTKTRYNPWAEVTEESPKTTNLPWVDESVTKKKIKTAKYSKETKTTKTTDKYGIKINKLKTTIKHRKDESSETTESIKTSTRSTERPVKDKLLATVDEMVCHLEGVKLVEAKFGKETHFLCLKLQPIGLSPLVTNDSILLLEPDTLKEAEYSDTDEEENIIQEYPIGHFTMAYGFPMEEPTSGSAEGYIGDDHQFYGVLHIGNRTLHADPYGRDDPSKVFGAFEHENMVVPPRRRRDHERTQMDTHFPFQIEQPRHVVGTARARICDLLLLADKEFYEKDANSSLNNVVQRMMHAVTQADIIFRNADFNEDGVPDNIGFTVKYILVLTSELTNKRVFGNLLDKHAVDGREYLMKFARLRRLSEVCLGVAFSGHAFHNRTLGLSFTSLGGGLGGAAGGLCDRRAYGRSFNTLAIAHATTADAERVPERIAALTLAHEMGHSFGAHHDDNFPISECRDHLMGSQSTSAENANHFEFSLCSKRLIATTLSSMSYCFTEEASPYCGNGIVEEGEACDCGLPSRCNTRDPCCTPRAGGILFYESGTVHKEGCSVAPSADCHPSQGLCCDTNCLYANLTKSGIDCKMQNLKCTCNDPNLCRCGLRGRCLEDWSCHAAECALLGLKECQCTQSPGGVIGETRGCGACCLLPAGRCVGAEEAAEDYVTRYTLPWNWPGDDMSGPNVTIRICTDVCRYIELRAWPAGSSCVSLGIVGACSARGVCGRVQSTPRSNLYPNVMHVKMQLKSSSRSFTIVLRPTSFLVFLSTLFVL